MLASFDFSEPELIRQNLNLLAVFMSALILSISLSENSKSHELRAGVLFRCGQSLMQLRDEVNLRIDANNIDTNDVEKWHVSYHQILNTCQFNHSRLDYKKCLIDMNHEREKNWSNWGKSTYSNFLFTTHVWINPILAGLSPLIFVGIIGVSKFLVRSYVDYSHLLNFSV